MTSTVRPEIGNPGNIEQTLGYPFAAASNRYAPKPPEHTWDLEWPLNIAVYSEMRRSDGQIGSLLKAIRLSVQRAAWTLDAAGCRPEVVEFVRSELGMTEPGQHRQRARRNGIVWTDHLREALLMLPFGHMFFEQVYTYRPEDNRIHLRKLAARLPTTIEEIHLARDGGLKAIRQTAPDTVAHPNGVTIPVDRLVAYVLDREGGDWTGQSILRTAYKHWLIKDQIMRIDAQSVERNGMGIPVMTYDPETAGAKEEAERIVSEVRAGESAGVVVPVDGAGTADGFKLVGVNGQTVDAVPKMEYHDQQISRSALAMFLDLGHDAGARSLGETFKDFFTDALQAVADDIAEVATEHIVRDLVEVNWGPGEPYPVVTPGRLRDGNELVADSLATLANAKIITPDIDTENFVRTRMGLPEREETKENVAGASAEGLAEKASFVGTMIRSGFDPEEAMRQAGLDPVKHLGLLPVTLQPPARGTDLDNAVAPVDEDGEEGEEGVPQAPAQPFVASEGVDPNVARLEAIVARMAQLHGRR